MIPWSLSNHYELSNNIRSFIIMVNSQYEDVLKNVLLFIAYTLLPYEIGVQREQVFQVTIRIMYLNLLELLKPNDICGILKLRNLPRPSQGLMISI